MHYFSPTIISPLADKEDVLMLTVEELEAITTRLCELHTHIVEALRQQDIPLVAWMSENCEPQLGTATSLDAVSSIGIAYSRDKTQAVIVERLLGREEIAGLNTVEIHRHPVIEVRLTATHLTVEYVLSPDAWVDQQNLAGKLSVSRHRQEINSLLKALDVGYCMGFWEGEHLSEMHLTTPQFQHPRVLEEWMSTFEPNADWFRLGAWYALDDEAVSSEQIVETVLNDVRALYTVYETFLWTSDNNFREFFSDVNSR